MLLFLFFILLFIIYRKRWFIKNLIFRFQERFSRKKDDTDVGPYKFDAFVLYSSTDADRLWVHFKLVHELEKNYGFRLCLEHRDFLGGIDKISAIEDAIRSSRKVLVIMSENFVKDAWCVEEVSMTMSVDRSKFIVVMYSNVMLSDVQIPAVIRRLLETKTLTEWNENAQAQKLFWKKLNKALYTQNKARRPLAAPEFCDSDSSHLL